MPNFHKVPKAKAHVDQSHARTQAAAWAWYQHAGAGSRGRGHHVMEARASRNVIAEFARAEPSRFKIEAELRKTGGRNCTAHEDSRRSVEIPGHRSRISDQIRSSEFRSSLFDSFELLAISKQLDESVLREETTRGPATESLFGVTNLSSDTRSNDVRRKVTPGSLGSKNGKKFPFQDSRHDRALFPQFRIGGPFCRSAETVSCQTAKHHVQAEKQSLTAGYANLDANDVPLFKRRSFARAAKKQTRYAQSTEENQEARCSKAERVLRMMSFKDVTKVLQEVNAVQQFHSGHQQRHDHHHHHHHHYFQFHKEPDGKL